jgi:hypothetical protein
VARALGAEYRVLALHQRGPGETAWATDYHWERWVEDLAHFVDTLTLERVHLLLARPARWGRHSWRVAPLSCRDPLALLIQPLIATRLISPQLMVGRLRAGPNRPSISFRQS